ncbi:Stage II sporulation protein P [Candidatus Syntrophocurvum alkaliphilum]|uniref:Stage II sporulation protein P n=1 Tax=Candidatus Syntrophocurvum alkaliphilum TaxID=2293317 RepID=A0A6I6D8L4_9FIRM|nr:stage II sporulation protein P [Candidatus Syntrophocurvum alkaliphilum]QGT99243.1 Stage II sporulation protein P [Candidatus Syntrophocurvum alkaliphilum]
MDSITRKYLWIFFGILISVMFVAYVISIMNTTLTPDRSPGHIVEEEIDYYIIKDKDGNVIFETGHELHVDDEYIDEDDIHYRIKSIDGNTATAEKIAKLTSLDLSNNETAPAISPFLRGVLPAQNLRPVHIVMYYTHSDESFIPTSGTASIDGYGDIYQVGETLAEALTTAGISVTNNQENHNPHDVNAYHRSRRTLTTLLAEQPDAAYDIHRDSAPARAYNTVINGTLTSRVMIVIGRGNPNMETNLDYARRLKEAADRIHPGLMRGIFMGRGDYNQDMYPTAILFEIGTQYQTLEMAQKGAQCLADIIIRVKYDFE